MAFHFQTVAEELLGVAAATGEWLRDRGYKVKSEHQELGYPFTPTLYGRRAPVTAIVEVDAEVVEANMREWAAFGASRTNDTRIWCAVAAAAKRTGKQDLLLKELGLGLLVVDGERVEEMIAPLDLAVNLRLPDLKRYPVRLQRTLGPVYEHRDRGEWREAFEEACVTLEDEARRHLWKGVKSGRIVVFGGNGKAQTLSKKAIDKLTMGALADSFGRILKQSHADRVVGDALKELNPTRIDVAHKKKTAGGEARLRKNVGAKMWVVIAALRELQTAT
jgi:hypothetical protein